MKTKTFEDILVQHADKFDLEDLIRMAKHEIAEWEKFIKLCRKKIEEELEK